MSHVKEISTTDPRMSSFLADWSASLKGICLLEQNLSEHHTVVQVYRSALEKDKAELLKVKYILCFFTFCSFTPTLLH